MSTSAIAGRRARPDISLVSASAEKPTVTRRVVAATVAGNALEFYDFVAYAFFAVYIGKAFCPATTAYASLLLSVAVFGVGFVSRPLGGLLIGAYADRAGRRPAMLLTIALITVGTLGLALTPSYASIGMAAPIIVVICRLIQGLALGGEVGPSTAFLLEIAPPNRRGLYVSWQLASQGASAFIAGLIGMAMSSLLLPAELQAWGWRVPFAIGLLLIPLAIYLRHSMPETLEAAATDSIATPAGSLRKSSGLITLSVVIVIGGTVSTYVGNYMTTFAIATLHLSPAVAMSATVMGGLSTFAFALVGGWLCDRFGRKPVMLIPRVLAAVLTYPAFLYLVDQKTTQALLLVSVTLAALTAISGTASITAIPELLPRNVRALGLSIAYAVGVALFGGTTQFFITWLITATGNPAAPAFYVAATSAVTALAMLAIPEGRDRALS